MKALFHHALDVVVEDGRYRPRRFTEKETDALTALTPFFGNNSRLASGVSLKCYTAAETVSFSYSAVYPFRRVGGFDVYENGVLVHNELLSGEDTEQAEFCYRKQTEGEILLEIYLPNAAEMCFWDLRFGDWRPFDASDMPLALWYGDSITQATGVNTPSLTFPALTSRLTGFDYINRGIGSLYYDVTVLDEDDPTDPDVIMVAFGSNDLVKHGPDKKLVYIKDAVQFCTEEDVPELMDNARAYLTLLQRCHPKAKIRVISVLWEVDQGTESTRKAAAAYHLALEKLAKELSMTFIHGLTVIPHLAQFCCEDGVHLNALGCMAAATTFEKYLKV